MLRKRREEATHAHLIVDAVNSLSALLDALDVAIEALDYFGTVGDCAGRDIADDYLDRVNRILAGDTGL